MLFHVRIYNNIRSYIGSSGHLQHIDYSTVLLTEIDANKTVSPLKSGL